MKNAFRTLALTSGILFLGAGAAQANPWNGSVVCGGSNFSLCASVGVSATSLGSDHWGITMEVWNLSGLDGSDSENWVFTTIGLANIGTTDFSLGNFAMGGPVRDGNDPGIWDAGTGTTPASVEIDLGLTSDGIDNGIASWCATSLPGGQNDLWQTGGVDEKTTGGSINEDAFTGSCVDELSDPFGPAVTITFDLWDNAGTFDPTFADSELIIRAQNGGDDNELSTVCETGNGCSVVPEPLSVILLGSGLVGVGGAALRRRRREEVEEEEDGDVAAV